MSCFVEFLGLLDQVEKELEIWKHKHMYLTQLCSRKNPGVWNTRKDL